MNKMLSKILCVLIALIFTFSFAACGNAEKTAAPTTSETAVTSVESTAAAAESTPVEPKAEEAVTLKIFTQYSLPEEKGPYDYAVAEMKKEMPNVTLDLEIQPQDGDAKLKTLAAAGDLPDILQVTKSTRDLFVSSNNLAQLDQYIKDTKIEDRILPAYKFLLYSDDGHSYAIPRTSMPTHLMYVNKDLFATNNIKIPTNYDEFLASIKAFKAKGIVPMSLFAKETWPGIMLLEDFATRYDAGGLAAIDTKKATFNSDAYKKASAQVEECVKAGMLAKGCFTTDYDTAFNEFTSGKSAYFVNGAWALGPIGEKMGDKVDFLDYPLADTATVEATKLNRPGGGFDGGYSVSANSKYKDVAGKFTALFSLQVANGRVVKAQEAYPLTTDGVQPEKPYPAIALKYVELSKQFKSTTRFPWGIDAEAYVALGDNTAKLLTGSYPADKFIADTDKALKDIYK
jgi:raffinose/stachyose/melibiose transport system substrate-binding protein